MQSNRTKEEVDCVCRLCVGCWCGVAFAAAVVEELQWLDGTRAHAGSGFVKALSAAVTASNKKEGRSANTSTRWPDSSESKHTDTRNMEPWARLARTHLDSHSVTECMC